MSNDLNLTIHTGRLGKKPEIKYTPSNVAVCNFSLAVGGRRKDGDNWVDATDWLDFVIWGKQAETLGKYCDKGSHIRVTGRLIKRKWQDQNGQDRYSTEIVGSEMQMLGGRNGADIDGGTKPQATEFPNFDDDIPF